MTILPHELTPAPPGWRIHPLAAEITAMVSGQRAMLAGALTAEIDAHWLAAQAESGGALFNGAVLSVDEITPALLRGHMTEYRRVLAQLRAPALFEALHLRPLAVCGVLLSPDGVVLGRRQRAAIYQSGMWQAPPAGNVDARALRPSGEVDLRCQLLTELREELGLTRDAVHAIRPIALVEHGATHVLDLGFLLTTPLPFTTIAAIHAGEGNEEYDMLRVVPLAALPDFLTRMVAEIVPSVPIFLAAAGLLGTAAR